MNEVQQRRRKAPRSRTPAWEAEGAEEMASPVTPKRRGNLKLLIPSFGPASKPSGNEDFFSPQFFSHFSADPNPDPSPEAAMESVMFALMCDARVQLDERFNGMLLRIFESYRNLKDERDYLQQRFNDEVAGRENALRDMKNAEKAWQSEKQDYVDEVKRLEVILSTVSSRGVAEVTLARQNSKIHQRKAEHKAEHRQKETIFEFLEKTRRSEDEAWSSQRATMKIPRGSPGAREGLRLKRLAQKKSMTSIHAVLPFTTPPIFARSAQENIENLNQADGASMSGSSDTDDTCSNLSCDARVRFDSIDQIKPTSFDPANEDLDATQRATTVLMRCRPMDRTDLRARFLGPFNESTNGRNGDLQKGSSIGNQGTTSKVAQPSKSGQQAATVAARSIVKGKATGFFQKLKPQPSVTVSSQDSHGLSRRFSFEPGDDGATPGLHGAGRPLIMGKGRFLRKAVSLTALGESAAQSKAMQPSLPTLSQSPNSQTTPPLPRIPSRIPTPRYSSSSLAKPRRERDGSTSSLATAIMRAEDHGPGVISRASSVYSAYSRRESWSGMRQTPDQGITVESQSARVSVGLEHANAQEAESDNGEASAVKT